MKRKITLGLIIVAGLATLLWAGSLNPSAPPTAGTMKTLDEIYNKPVWRISNQVFTDWPSNPRFAVCEGELNDFPEDDLVLDKETGLIWARDPSANSPLSQSWLSAKNICHMDITLGFRRGWRMPSVEELSSLIDTSVQTSLALPTGHPFLNVKTDYYWSATEYITPFLEHAWSVKMTKGFPVVTSKDKTASYYVWPVRGGSGPDTRLER
jgi:hypothetical protein